MVPHGFLNCLDVAKHTPPATLSSGMSADGPDPARVRHILDGCPVPEPGCPVCAARELPLASDEAVVDPKAHRPGSWWSASAQFGHRPEQLETEVGERRSEQIDHALLEQLASRSKQQQLLLVSNSDRFVRPGLCALLLTRSFESRFDEPTSALESAEVAVAVAERLSETALNSATVHSLKARAWIGLGNAQRLLGDFRQAEEALGTATQHLMRGDVGPEELALWLDVEGSLRSTQGRFEEALRSTVAAGVLYREAGDAHSVGRVLIKRGMIGGYVGDLTAAIQFARQGLELIDESRDPRLVIAGWHNLLFALHRMGYHREALAGLARARPLYLQVGERITLMRFQWLEGLIATALDRLEQAEGCLRSVRRQFIELGIAFDAALVSLDLAAVLGRQGRYAEVRCLATEMIAVFESHRVHREALAALILLQQAARRERVTAELLTQLAARLDRTGSSATVSGG